MRLTIPEQEIMSPGHLACQGCGGSLAMRYALKIFGKDTMLTIPACCWAVIDGPYPYTAVNVPLFHTAFETAAIMASGIKAGLEVQGNTSTNVIAWAGDGGTFDIGMQAISGAAERNDDITYIVYDNEAYMNTGIQRSSATPHGAWTTTTPVKHYKKGPKKNMVEIMAAHRIPYTATASVGYPEDLRKKLERAKNTKGFKFIHILAPCPTGWKTDPRYTVKLAKLAVQTNIFPLYEIEDGLHYKQNMKIKERKPIKEYFKYQGRFKHLPEDEVSYLQDQVDKNFEILSLKFE
ncbi:MAG TPA: 3-methyl-2-oxobutanoate dehydrogenase subunit beta [Candidatus Cloacimonetes bacterium]|nr:3-methyl-2-oxobutanoate dehydrogenase subunit beta [Candidatus Cloacimonadota bacterium]HEX37300.1 3-methyl-2-oxobutanoate dehydrogenase subunit beta [Candidatus Cloacimonadota bacterium]